jgi:hypothetical protein
MRPPALTRALGEVVVSRRITADVRRNLDCHKNLQNRENCKISLRVTELFSAQFKLPTYWDLSQLEGCDIGLIGARQRHWTAIDVKPSPGGGVLYSSANARCSCSWHPPRSRHSLLSRAFLTNLGAEFRLLAGHTFG